MRKVVLTMDEQNKYEIIKKLVDSNGNKNRAALKLGCTRRTVNRLVRKYKKEGKAGFIHGNKGRTPVNKLSDVAKAEIYLFYNNKYFEANFKHFTECLNKYENINVAESTVRNIFKEMEQLSPMAHRKTKRELKKKLKHRLNKTKVKKEQNVIKEQIMEVDDPHPRREKSKFFGEMQQVDASVCVWWGQHEMHLHAAIDDATGVITAAYFDVQETLNGYYNMFSRMLSNYGAPNLLYTDNRTVFEYNKKGINDVTQDTFTQFGYACKQLGVEIKTTSVSQAKGKIERLFKSLQSRLPVEMRIAGVKTIKEANAFLEEYIPKYNKQFALNPDCIKSVFEKVDEETINNTLAVLADRKIDNGHCIKYKKKYYKIVDGNGHQKFFKKGTEVVVAKTFNEQLYVNVAGTNYALSKVLEHEKVNNAKKKNKCNKQRKKYIPPAEHPWKKSSWERYLYKQKFNVA